MDKARRDLLVFGYGLAVIAAGFGLGGAFRHGFSWAPATLLTCALVFTSVTAFRPAALQPGYRGWMAVAGVIGSCVTTAILGAVFIFVFVPVGLLLRLLGKDHLQRQKDAAAPTYWQRCPSDHVLKERYLQQF